MTLEEKAQLDKVTRDLETLSRDFRAFLDVYQRTNYPTKQVFEKDVDFEGSVAFNGSLSLNALEVTQFGLGLTPVSRQANIAAPTGGATVDTEARTAISSILTLLDTFGFTS